MQYMGNPVADIHPIDRICSLVLRLIQKASNEWARMLEWSDDEFKAFHQDCSCPDARKVADDGELEEWLYKFEEQTVTVKHSHGRVPPQKDFPEAAKNVKLCSCCGRPSVALKKCKGCGTAQ